MARPHLTGRLARTVEAMTVLFCLTDDAYAFLNPGGRRYESLKRLSDSEILTLALLQQLRAWSPAAHSCAGARGSSVTCSPELLDTLPLRSTGA